MTNDEKITTIAKLLREMSDEFGVGFGASSYGAGHLYEGSTPRFAVSIGGGHGSDPDPMKALTEALSDAERKADEKALKAEVEAEVKARMALRKAA